MLYQSLQELNVCDDPAARPAPVAGALPPDLVWCERAVALLRAALREVDLEDWKIYYAGPGGLDLDDLDEHLPKFEAGVAWQRLPSGTAGGELPALLVRRAARVATAREAGWVLLRRQQVAVARWYWRGERGTDQLWLVAAPAPRYFQRLHRRVVQLRRRRAASVWQFVAGESWNDGPRKPREPVREQELLLIESLRQRVVSDMIGFFSKEVAALYGVLGVPYRRGVLLHGPPGNGKTSLIRYVGGALRRIPAMILRPGAQFDSDDMQEVLRRWRRQAPAILVIEDLDWLLAERVNVSTFLNQIDGIDGETTGGLLLIATTNNPEKLDPAINNRPGRFDVVIEVPSPDGALRRRFLVPRLRGISAGTLDKIVSETDGLSFAHLQEILRLSGLLAIREGRGDRTDEDALRATEMVRQSHDDAARGFPRAASLNFGLHHLRRLRSEG